MKNMDEKAQRYEQLTAYLDGELPEEQRREVERLLEQDADAGKLLEELRETSRLVAAMPRCKASPELMASIMGRLERRELLAELEPPRLRGRKTSSLQWVRPLGVAAGMAIICTASWLIYTQTETMVARKASPSGGIAQRNGADKIAPTGASEREGPDNKTVAARPSHRTEGPDLAFGASKQRRSEEAEERNTAAAAAPTDAGKLSRRAQQAAPKSETLMGESLKRDTLATAERPAGTLGKPHLEAADAAKEPPAAVPGRRLDDALAANKLDVGSILEADCDEFSNRIVLQTDQYTAQEITARVKQFMSLREIQDLRTSPSNEPVAETQAFYAVGIEGDPANTASRREEILRWEPIRVVANLSVGDAAKLVESLQQVTRRRQNAQWMANSRPLSGRESVDELAGLMLTFAMKNDAAGGSGTPTAAPNQIRSAAGGAARSGEERFKGERQSNETLGAGNGRRTRPEPAASTTPPATQPAPGDDRFVTLAILLTPTPAPLPPSARSPAREGTPASSPAATQHTETPSEDEDDGQP